MKYIRYIILQLLFVSYSLVAQENLLILAPDDFVSELQVLKKFKDCTGRPTYLLSLSYIDGTFSGADLPEKVKKCIVYYKQNYNIDYVLLAGDCDKFPVRYVRAYNTEWGNKYYPSDLYFADLFNSYGAYDNWDGNNNGIIGEMDFLGGTDINLVNLDNINMYPDVAVARIPASDITELETYVNKVIDYEIKAPGNWFYNAMVLVDGGDSPWGDSTKTNDDVVPYLQGSGFNVIKRYGTDPYWSTLSYQSCANEFNTRLNSGVGFANFYGHGNRLFFSSWYDESYMDNLTNQYKLPVIFATACLTGRFHFDREYYMDKYGNEWDRRAGPWPPVSYPEPMAIQPSIYDSYNNESMAEQFLVKRSTGGIGYIGVVSKAEQGMWMSDPSESVGLAPYFFENFYYGYRPLGILWKNAMSTFVSDVVNIGMGQYAFIHIHKVQLFGDPSLTVGGSFTNYLYGDYYDGWGGPWYNYMRGKLIGDVTVPVNQKLTINYGASILFTSGTKIIAYDSNSDNGLVVNGTQNAPVSFFSQSPEPQAAYFLYGMKVYSQVKLHNGGQIKLY